MAATTTYTLDSCEVVFYTHYIIYHTSLMMYVLCEIECPLKAKITFALNGKLPPDNL